MKAADLNHAFAIAVNMSRIWLDLRRSAPASVRDFGVADLKKSEPQMFVDSNDDVRAETGDKFPRHIYHSSSAKMIGNSRRLECLIYPRKPRRFNERRIILVARFNDFERN